MVLMMVWLGVCGRVYVMFLWSLRKLVEFRV